MKHGVTPNKGKKEEETIVCNTVQNGEPFLGHKPYSAKLTFYPASVTTQGGLWTGRFSLLSLHLQVTRAMFLRGGVLTQAGPELLGFSGCPASIFLLARTIAYATTTGLVLAVTFPGIL
jgi:hypothetical protein